MRPFLDSVLVGSGAAIGGLARHWLGHWIQSRAEAGWPLGTFMINLSGSLALGILAGVLRGEGTKQEWQLFLGVGLLGGFTTFSAFSLQMFELIEEKRLGAALAYAAGSVVLGLALAAVGYALGRALSPK